MSDSSNGRLFEAPPAPARTRTKFIRDLSDGEAVADCFVVSARSLRQRRNGEHFLTLTLRDRTGALSAVCWENATSLQEIAEPGAVVRAVGRFERHERWGAQLNVHTLAAAEEGEYSFTDLVEGPAVSVEKMEEDLRRLG